MKNNDKRSPRQQDHDPVTGMPPRSKKLKHREYKPERGASREQFHKVENNLETNRSQGKELSDKNRRVSPTQLRKKREKQIKKSRK